MIDFHLELKVRFELTTYRLLKLISLQCFNTALHLISYMETVNNNL